MTIAKIRGEITMTGQRVPEGFSPDGNAWRVELRYRDSTMTTPFYTGSALGEPAVADVVASLISDASGADQDFESWAGDYGYDNDSRSAYATWEAVVAQADKLRELLGDAFDAAISADDPELWAKRNCAEA